MCIRDSHRAWHLPRRLRGHVRRGQVVWGAGRAGARRGDQGAEAEEEQKGLDASGGSAHRVVENRLLASFFYRRRSIPDAMSRWPIRRSASI